MKVTYFNAELLFGLPIIKEIDILRNIHPYLLFDIGQVWNEYRNEWKFQPKTNVGIGIQLSSNSNILRFNVAKALDSEQDIQLNLMFNYSY